MQTLMRAASLTRRLTPFGALACCLALAACAREDQPAALQAPLEAANLVEQRTGDAVRGRMLLLDNGTADAPYLSCGVPRRLLDLASLLGVDVFGDAVRLSERGRGNAALPYDLSYATTRTGVQVVTTNCLLCHASKLGGELVIGLGNPNLDFTGAETTFGLPPVARDLLALTLNANERAELQRFSRVSDAAASMGKPATRGLNPADVMFGVLAAHRDANTLQWRTEADPNARLDVDLVFSDVPAWWNLHRRDRMFYSGFGRGDHARIMMSAALMCLEGSDEAAAIDSYFPDIAAFIMSLRAPKYQAVAHRAIDAARTVRGRDLYVANCASCHGDSERDIDPLPSVSADEVGTDPAYAFKSSQQGDGAIAYFFDFFNRSWYGTHGAAGQLVREERPAYSPPPLDGVWATAPYFHNGSVPTLDAVLDPALRPTIFRRSFKPEEYDFERLGWPFEEVAAKAGDTTVYDTTRETYRNTGHAYAAGLSSDERRDLLEYLKTL
jgi:mono/diheme cytochrome c family protein